MTRFDEDTAMNFLLEKGFGKEVLLLAFDLLVSLLVEYPYYYEDKRAKHILENSPEIRQRLINVAAKMDLPINKEA